MARGGRGGRARRDRGARRRLPERHATRRSRPRPLHYDELDLRGAFHHSPAEVDRALALLAAERVDWRALAAGPIGLDELPEALAERGGPAKKWVVRPG